MTRSGTLNLGAMVSGTDADTWNQMTASNLLGVKLGTSGTPGASLPASTAQYGDRAAVWWSPDSPAFWFAAIVLVTAFGMAGADARVRLFKSRASASVGRA